MHGNLESDGDGNAADTDAANDTVGAADGRAAAGRPRTYTNDTNRAAGQADEGVDVARADAEQAEDGGRRSRSTREGASAAGGGGRRGCVGANNSCGGRKERESKHGEGSDAGEHVEIARAERES